MGQGSEPGDLHQLSNTFRRFVTTQFRGYSPLYEQIALGVADDREVLALAHGQRSRAVTPLLFLGAVQYLLLAGLGDGQPLGAYFPSVSEQTKAPKGVYPYFRAFCLEHRDEIRRLVETRMVQTNEVQRCTSLLPAFEMVRRDAGERPLALVEVGTSAGLNLLWDRYGYDYGSAGRAGDASSPVQLNCDLQGQQKPPLPGELPGIKQRTGIDLNPINVRDPEQTLWLRALIWPEHLERAALLEKAVALAREEPPELIAGDVFNLLPRVLDDVPQDAALCLFHSYTIVQFPPEKREEFARLIEEAGAKRDLYHVSLEWLGEAHSTLSLRTFRGGSEQISVLAYCHPHGRWLEWLRG